MGCLLPSLVKLPPSTGTHQTCHDRLHHFSFHHLVMNLATGIIAQPCYTPLHTFCFSSIQHLLFFFQFLTLLGDCGSSRAEAEFHRENSCCGLGRVFPNLAFLQKHSRAHGTYSPLPFPCSRMEKGIGGTKGKDHKLRARGKNNYIIILQLIAYKVQSYFNIKHHHT